MSDVVVDWARDQRAFFEAKELWRQAAKALPKLDAALPVETRQLVFDRFLAENPAALYAAIPKLHEAHWPLLKDALARSSDVEARLLLDAPASARAELADFVAAITGATFGHKVTAKVLELGPLPASVLRGCVDLFAKGYPPFSVSQIAVFVAVMSQGNATQRRVVLAHEPPPEAVAWLQPTLKKLTPDTAREVKARIAGRQPTSTGYRAPEPFKRVHFSAPQPALATATIPEHAAEEVLLARAYAKPDDTTSLAVYADALLQRGAPLGELLQLQLARHAGKRGTLKREKLLFETAGAAALWPEHPATRVGAYLRFEDIELGFPAQLRIGRPPPAEQLTTLLSLAGHPGWATLRRIYAPVQLHRFLPDEMPMLSEVWDVRGDELQHLATKQWPVTKLSLTSLASVELPTFRGLPKLSHLTVYEGLGEEVFERLDRMGLLARLTSLSLNSGVVDPPVLELFARAPQKLERLLLTFNLHSARAHVTAVRTAGKPRLELDTDAFSLETVEAWLRALDPKAVSRVEVTLSSHGSFRKAERAEAEHRMSRLLSRFTEHALHSKHPTR